MHVNPNLQLVDVPGSAVLLTVNTDPRAARCGMRARQPSFTDSVLSV